MKGVECYNLLSVMAKWSVISNRDGRCRTILFRFTNRNIGNFRCTNPILLVYTNVWSLADSGIRKFDKFVGKKVYMYTTIQTKIASLKIFPGQVLYILQIVQYIFSYFPYTFFNKIFF